MRLDRGGGSTLVWQQWASRAWFFLALLAPGNLARADTLHAFGPRGTPSTRRVMVVLEPTGGGCASWDGVSLEVNEAGATVELGEVAGSCARWVLVRSDPPRPRVVLRATGSNFSATSVLALGPSEHLELRAVRRGEHIEVVVSGAAEGQEVTVSSIVGTERRALERRTPTRFEGTAPPDELVGIVGRSGELVGATALPPGARPDGPRVLILPSELAVEAGGPPRDAAFLVVVDARGRLSRSVPVRIESERGQLRSMRWLQTGVAVLGLSVELGTASIDLAVSLGDETLARGELATVAGWPASAQVEVPADVERGATFEVQGSATSLDGSPLAAGTLRVRCGDDALLALPATCSAASDQDRMSVDLVAMIDGLAVPLSNATVALRDPELVAERPVAIEEPPRPAPPPGLSPTRRGRIVGFVRPGVDIWGHFVGGVGGRVELPVGVEWLRLSAGAEYAVSPFSAAGQSSVDDELGVVRHRVGGTVGGVISFEGDVGGVIRGELAVSYGRVDASLRSADGSTDELALEGRVAGGVRLRAGGIELGADVIAAVGGPVTSGTWAAAPVAVALEVSVAALAP